MSLETVQLVKVGEYYQPAPAPIEKKSRRGRKRKKRPTPEEEIQIIERRERVFDLRKEGHTIYQIARKLEAEGFPHFSTGIVHRDLQAVLTERRRGIANRADDYLEIELAKIDDMEKTIFPRARDLGSRDDIRSQLDLMKQRDKLLNISETTKAENNAKKALAALLGVAVDQLPERVENPKQIAKRSRKNSFEE